MTAGCRLSILVERRSSSCQLSHDMKGASFHEEQSNLHSPPPPRSPGLPSLSLPNTTTRRWFGCSLAHSQPLEGEVGCSRIPSHEGWRRGFRHRSGDVRRIAFGKRRIRCIRREGIKIKWRAAMSMWCLENVESHLTLCELLQGLMMHREGGRSWMLGPPSLQWRQGAGGTAVTTAQHSSSRPIFQGHWCNGWRRR